MREQEYPEWTQPSSPCLLDGALQALLLPCRSFASQCCGPALQPHQLPGPLVSAIIWGLTSLGLTGSL